MSNKDPTKSSATTTNKSDTNNTAINLSTPSRKAGDNQLANSCLSGPNNPKTLKRTKEGKIQVVHFDERVVVHTVPHWDPSRTQSFSDVSQPGNNDTCNCCIIQQQQQQQQQQSLNSTNLTNPNQTDNNNDNNPITILPISRLSDESKVSWDKSIIVHRVPDQCCILLL